MPRRKSDSVSNKKEAKDKEDKDNKLRIFCDDNFASLLESSTKEITHYIKYISFGILIAIFKTKHAFIREYKVTTIVALVFATSGLFIDNFITKLRCGVQSKV